MAFAGVSLISDGKLCPLTATLVDARADRGYHLLHIEGYSGSKAATPNGEYIKSRPFLLGGHRWRIHYYPNGWGKDCEQFMSVFAVLEDDVKGQEVKAEVVFSFIDQPELRIRVRKMETTFRYIDGEAEFMRSEFLERSRHLKSDSFIIRCDINVFKTAADASTGAGATDSFFDMPPMSDLQSHFGDLLLSKEGADITFEVGGKTFSAHRCVLSARSAVFKELVFDDTTITKTKKIEINDMEPEIFRNLLVFIYTDSFPDWEWEEDDKEGSGEQENEEETESGEGEEEEEAESGEGEEEEEAESGEEEEEEFGEYVTWLVQLHEAADRYDLQRLKLICAEQLLKYICKDTVADIIIVAEQTQCPWLKERCVEFIKSHSSLYTALPAESLNHIIRTCSPLVLKELIFKFSP